MKCPNCEHLYKHIGHGEGWYQCSIYQKKGDAYANILWGLGAKYEKNPSWCPLKALRGEE